jgi:hypothetical protein
MIDALARAVVSCMDVMSVIRKLCVCFTVRPAAAQ